MSQNGELSKNFAPNHPQLLFFVLSFINVVLRKRKKRKRHCIKIPLCLLVIIFSKD